MPILNTTVVPCTTQSVIRFPCGHAGPQQWPLAPRNSCWGTASSPYVSLTAQMGQSSMFSSESCGSAHIFCHVAVPSSSNPSTPVRDSGTRVRVCHGTRVRGIQAMRCQGTSGTIWLHSWSVRQVCWVVLVLDQVESSIRSNKTHWDPEGLERLPPQHRCAPCAIEDAEAPCK